MYRLLLLPIPLLSLAGCEAMLLAHIFSRSVGCPMLTLEVEGATGEIIRQDFFVDGAGARVGFHSGDRVLCFPFAAEDFAPIVLDADGRTVQSSFGEEEPPVRRGTLEVVCNFGDPTIGLVSPQGTLLDVRLAIGVFDVGLADTGIEVDFCGDQDEESSR